MEFFLLVLKQVCKVLSLSIAIGSKTVGKEVGRQENARKFARVMENWRQVWARDQVRAKEALVLPVALDERTVPQDWVCVLVRSITAGEKLGDAKQLLLRVYDHAKRVSASRKLAFKRTYATCARLEFGASRRAVALVRVRASQRVDASEAWRTCA